MRRARLAALLGLTLAACSSGVSVEMCQLGTPAGPGCPAPEQRVFAYRTCASVFDPLCMSRAPYQIMQDAARTAPLLALGPAPLAAGALLPTAYGAAQGLEQRLTSALSAEAQLSDHRRALLEFGQLLATAPQSGAAGQTLPSTSLKAALENRLARIVVGEPPGTLAAGTGYGSTPPNVPAPSGSPSNAPAGGTPPGGGGGFEGAAQRTPARRALPPQADVRTASLPARPSESAVRAMAQRAAVARRRAPTSVAVPTSIAAGASVGAKPPARAPRPSDAASAALPPPLVRPAPVARCAPERAVTELARR